MGCNIHACKRRGKRCKTGCFEGKTGVVVEILSHVDEGWSRFEVLTGHYGFDSPLPAFFLTVQFEVYTFKLCGRMHNPHAEIIARQEMTDDDHYPAHSPHSQAVTQHGKTVQVEIYEDGQGGWLLEVVDEFRASTVWDDPFPTDREALDEALKTIEEEGIESLISTPPDQQMPPQEPELMEMMAALSDEEMDELDRFLMSDATSDNTMMLDCLDGYLTALATGPVSILPSQWLPGIWGPTEKDEPVFDSFKQAERITGLIFRQLNGIIWSLQHNPDEFEPIFDTAIFPDDSHEYADGEMWAYGFMSGIMLQRESWQALFDDPKGAEVLRPIYLLGAEEATPEEEALTETPEQREKLTEQIPASVAWIYRFWLPYRVAMTERSVATTFERGHPKVGRNDPCPCGSGKKFKKCCGASTILH